MATKRKSTRGTKPQPPRTRSKGKRTPRCSEQEKAARLFHVADLLCNGLDLHHICREPKVQEWKLDRETIRRDYVKPAWKELRKYIEDVELPEKRAKALVERDRLKLRAIAKKDFATALRAMDSRDKIEGILVEKEQPVGLMFNVGEIPAGLKDRLDRELGVVFGGPGKEKKSGK